MIIPNISEFVHSLTLFHCHCSYSAHQSNIVHYLFSLCFSLIQLDPFLVQLSIESHLNIQHTDSYYYYLRIDCCKFSQLALYLSLSSSFNSKFIRELRNESLDMEPRKHEISSQKLKVVSQTNEESCNLFSER